MSRTVRLRPRAHDDVVDHYLYIQSDSADAAERFLQSLDDAYHTLAAYPFAGRSYPSDDRRLSDLRIHRLASPYRNYAIFYVVTESAIDVARILHGSMNITPDFFDR